MAKKTKKSADRTPEARAKERMEHADVLLQRFRSLVVRANASIVDLESMLGEVRASFEGFAGSVPRPGGRKTTSPKPAPKPAAAPRKAATRRKTVTATSATSRRATTQRAAAAPATQPAAKPAAAPKPRTRRPAAP